MEDAFAAAEVVVSRYFADRREDPTQGTIEISGERYLLIRAAALSVDFFDFVAELYGEGREQEAADFARNILFDLAHGLGRNDAKRFHAQMGLTDPLARLSAGPVHFAHAGWAFVDILPGSSPSPNEDFFIIYDHPYSFESDAWLRAGKPSSSPTCIMSAGYSSGWCQESYGLPLVAAEISCRANGGDVCRFIMAPPLRIEAHVSAAAPGADTVIPNLFARKRLVDALRTAHDELEHRVEERTAALVRAVEERERVERLLRQRSKLESLGRLAGGVAHDFNNLLAVVVMNTRVVSRSLVDGDPRAAQLDEIANACSRAAELTRQLLAFGGASRVAHASVELDSSVADLGQMLERLVGDAIMLEVDTRAEGLSVPLDRSQLDQVLVNLIVNARDAMPSGGTLTVETHAFEREAGDSRLGLDSGHHAMLVVRDTGIGMDEETRLAIFEPFFSTRSDRGGTGLGLSTVYGLITQAGGTIEVESAPHKGSTFRVFLPVVETIETPAPPPVDTKLRGHGETVLVVEDLAPVRKVVSRLTSLLGYQVVTAANAEEALDIATRDGCDILLTDLMLPRMNGVTLAERVLEVCPTVRVVFMSGNAGDALERWRAEGREFTLLAKPFGDHALAAALAASERRSP